MPDTMLTYLALQAIICPIIIMPHYNYNHYNGYNLTIWYLTIVAHSLYFTVTRQLFIAS